MVGGSAPRAGVEPEPLVLQADNGAPMKGITLLAMLQVLGVTPSFSRPRVSNHNPYSESLFRTVKYRPWYPQRPFSSVLEPRESVETFVHWCTDEHRHSAIRFVTPNEGHTGRDREILDQRKAPYEHARRRQPKRWSLNTRDWTPPGSVRLNPPNCHRRTSCGTSERAEVN